MFILLRLPGFPKKRASKMALTSQNGSENKRNIAVVEGARNAKGITGEEKVVYDRDARFAIDGNVT